MKPILLCEPNISEGRNRDLVERVCEPLRQTPGVKLLDYSSDPDHNRSVYSYLGAPRAVLEATKAFVALALDEIDMTRHQGTHPRQGAVDVVPFVPIQGISIPEAVEIARELGRFVGGLGVPVFYYEAAATRPARKSLPEIRKGQYEGQAEKLKDPAWQPDEGPAVFNPKSGGLVTGVRLPLVAFNVNLRTTDVGIAEQIAQAVRHISGGYRYVRALGLPLEAKGMVQVSMNLIDYTRTPLHRVLETVRSEAARFGVSVAGTELVGPVPLGLADQVFKYYLQAHEFNLDQIIETALID